MFGYFAYDMYDDDDYKPLNEKARDEESQD